MERYLSFETLYSRKFEKYLGQPEVGPKRDYPLTEADRRAEEFRRMKRPDYDYESGNTYDS